MVAVAVMVEVDAVNAEVGRGEEKFMVGGGGGGGVNVGWARDRARLRRECMSSYFFCRCCHTNVALGGSSASWCEESEDSRGRTGD